MSVCSQDLSDEDATLAEIPRLLLVGFLERQRAHRPTSAVQKLPLSIDLDLDAHSPWSRSSQSNWRPVFPDGPEVFIRLPLAGRGRMFGRIEGLVAHRCSRFNASGGFSVTCGAH